MSFPKGYEMYRKPKTVYDEYGDYVVYRNNEQFKNTFEGPPGMHFSRNLLQKDNSKERYGSSMDAYMM